MSRFSFLVAEDDPFMKPIMARILFSIDPELDLTWVGSVAEAKSALKAGRFDLVITDHILPGIEKGTELCIFCEKTYPKMPILLISGLTLTSLQKTLGFNPKSVAYLGKPFRFDECKKVVANLIHSPCSANK